MEKTELKNIVILATGGTIAGKASSGSLVSKFMRINFIIALINHFLTLLVLRRGEVI